MAVKVISIVVGVRRRHCSECGDAIEKGEPHLRIKMGSHDVANLCYFSLSKLNHNLRNDFYKHMMVKRRSGT